MSLWTPAEITTALWLDAADPTTITIDTGISSWADKKGNGINVIQATAGQQPNYDSTGLNGLPTIEFDGTDDKLTRLSSGLSSLANLTVFFVGFPASNPGGYRCFLSTCPNGGNDYSSGIVLDQGTSSSSNWSNLNVEGVKGGTSTDLRTSSQSFGGASIVCLTSNDLSDNTKSKLYVNGIEEGNRSASTAAINASQINLGSRFYSGVHQGHFHGSLSEIILISSSVSITDRQKIEGYLAWKWGLESSLPSGHPYKNAAPNVVPLWTPAGMAGLVAWYDPSDSGNYTLDGSYIAQLDDISGNGNHLTVKSGATRPTIAAVQQNGLDAINCSVSSALVCAPGSPICTSAMCIFGGHDFTGSTTYNRFPLLLDNGSAGRPLDRYNGTAYAGSTPLSAAYNVNTIATPCICHIHFTGTYLKEYWNTLLKTNFSHTAGFSSTDQKVSLGARNDLATWFLGYIFEQLIFSAIPSDDDIKRLQGWYAHKWGLTNVLPANHPYKTSPPNAGEPVPVLGLHWNYLSVNHHVSDAAGKVLVSDSSSWNTSEISGNNTRNTGKWYWEFVIGAGSYWIIGFTYQSLSGAQIPGNGVAGCSWQNNGSKFVSGPGWASVAIGSYVSGDVIGFLVDFDAGTVKASKNGTLLNSGNPVMTGLAQAIWPTGTMSSINGEITAKLLDSELTYLPVDYEPWDEVVDPPPVTQTLHAFIDQPYAMEAADLFCWHAQQYSMVLEIWLTQHYGDVPIIGTSLEQPYSWASVIHKTLVQRWGDALHLETSLEQPWTMPDMLQAVSEQSYGITTAILQATCEQLYHINANSSLFANLIQPYALAGEAARLYQFDTRLYVNGERIRYHSLEWQATESEYALSCDFSVKLQADAMKCIDGAEIRITSAGDTYLLKCYGGWFLDKRHGSEVYRVSGYSRTRDLDLAMPLLGDLPAGMASQLVSDLAAPFGITVDWQMADGYIEAGKISANDESPLTVIKNIVHDGRGIVLSTPAGNLLIVAEEELPIPDWATVTPTDTIIARLERISTSEQRDEQRGYNFFKVSDQLASGDGYRFEEVSIDAHTKEIRLFVTPMNAGRQFALGHSGGADVSIEPFGIQPLVIVNELVEFVAGSGQTSKPIYNITGSTWQETDLGNFTHTETGLLTANIPEYSLLLISYQTRYFRWIGRDRNIKHVQFIYYEVSA